MYSILRQIFTGSAWFKEGLDKAFLPPKVFQISECEKKKIAGNCWDFLTPESKHLQNS